MRLGIDKKGIVYIGRRPGEDFVHRSGGSLPFSLLFRRNRTFVSESNFGISAKSD